MKSSLRALLVLVICLIATIHCNAQFGSYDNTIEGRWAFMRHFLAYKKALNDGENMKKWWKTESTIGLAFSAPPTYTLRSRYDTYSGSAVPSYDTVKKGTGRSIVSVQGNGNSSHLLVRTSSNSMISFSAGLEAEFFRYQLLGVDPNITVNGKEGTMYYIRAGAPVTLDYKWGSDVNFDPDVKGCFSIGSGVMPYYSNSILSYERSQASFHVAPYIYASVGFYAFACWKIRAAYIPGNTQLFKDNESDNGGVISSLSAHTGGTFTIGIGLMAHSYDWRKGHAERTGWGSGGGGSHHGRGWSGDETSHMRMF